MDKRITAGSGKRNAKGLFGLEHWQVIAIYLVLYDLMTVNLAYFIVLWFRFDCRFSMIPGGYLHSWMKFAPVYSLFCILVFWYLRLYKSLWRFEGYTELTRVVCSTVITSVFHFVFMTVFVMRMPASYYCFGAILQFLLLTGVRYSYRFILLERGKRDKL